MPSSRFLSLAALVVLCVALVPVLVVGLPAPTLGSGGIDSDCAIAWTHDFLGALSLTNPWPRWLPSAAGGFGSPVFMFYPPIGYSAGALISLAASVNAAHAVAISMALAGLTGFLTMRITLRRNGAPTDIASIAAAVYVGSPYLAVTDMFQRAAFAEYMTIAVLPLLPLALHPPIGGAMPRLARTAIAYAALLYTHFCTAVVAGPLLLVYAFVQFRDARVVFAAVGGCALGAVLAAPLLVPAELLQAEIFPAAWGFNEWVTYLPFWGKQFAFSGGPVYIKFIYVILGWLAASTAVFWLAGRGHAGALASLLTAVFLLTPLSLPVWYGFPPLQLAQFPFRLLAPASCYWALAFGTALSNTRRLAFPAWAKELVALAGIVPVLMSAAAIGLIVSGQVAGATGPAKFLPWDERLTAALGSLQAYPAEYLPTAARLAGVWRVGQSMKAHYIVPPSELPQTPVVRGNGEVVAQAGATDVTARCPQPCHVVLHQFYFPGWAIASGPADAQVSADPDTGLLSVALPAGTNRVVLTRVRTGAEALGWLVGFAGLAVLLAISLVGRRRSVLRTRHTTPQLALGDTGESST